MAGPGGGAHWMRCTRMDKSLMLKSVSFVEMWRAAAKQKQSAHDRVPWAAIIGNDDRGRVARGDAKTLSFDDRTSDIFDTAVEQADLSQSTRPSGKIRFTQRLPTFAGGSPPLTIDVHTIDGLLNNARIASWRGTFLCGSPFSAFMKVPGVRVMLLAVFGDNASWIVLGFLDGEINLPVWSPPARRAS